MSIFVDRKLVLDFDFNYDYDCDFFLLPHGMGYCFVNLKFFARAFQASVLLLLLVLSP